jgi:RNA polymerase sigma-70 factor (ECF subfamily)
MSSSAGESEEGRAALERSLGQLRPKLHRYCARMTGSVIDGEDVVQEAMVKALSAFPETGLVVNLDAWMFRIAHNAALDFLRRRRRHDAVHSAEELEMIASLTNPIADRQAAETSLRTFMQLPVTQRSCVILMDVLGYSLEEIGGVTGISVPAIKAALNRGRTRLRELAAMPEYPVPAPALSDPERALLTQYVDRFNARDFDAVRDMLADEVRLDLVNRARMKGRSEVGRYFHNYSGVDDWHFVLGLVDRRPALLACDPRNPAAAPQYFVLLHWAANKLTSIRDFRHARYVTDGAEVIVAP